MLEAGGAGVGGPRGGGAAARAGDRVGVEVGGGGGPPDTFVGREAVGARLARSGNGL